MPTKTLANGGRSYVTPRPILRVTVAACVVGMFAGIANAEPRILAYGDSNTWGWIPVEIGFPTTRYPDQTRWPGVMERSLDERMGDVSVVVDALSGRTVDTVYPEPQNGVPADAFAGSDDVRAAVAAELPLDAVVVMLGTNDARSDLAAEPLEVARATSELVRQVRDINGGVGTSYEAPRVLVVAPPAIGDTSGTPISEVTRGSQARSNAIADAIIKAGEADGFEVLDAREIVTVDSVDGVHLTAEMHEALGTAVAERVAELLADER